MTLKQKQWLDANAQYRIMGQAPAGGFHFTDVKFLTPDGETLQKPRVATDKPIPEGSFPVGILAQRQVGHANGG